jgi:anti-sigma B factor antagonist
MTMTMQSLPSTTGLAIEMYEAGGRTVVTLRGTLDATTAPQLEAQFAELTQRRAHDVDLDISGLDSMDANGLSVVLAEHRHTMAVGGGLVIHHPNRSVIRLFQLNGLMSYLVVQPRMPTQS